MLRQFRNEVDVNPTNALLRVALEIDNDIDERIAVLDELTYETRRSVTTKTYQKASKLAEDLLEFSTSVPLSIACREDTMREGTIKTASLGSFLICKALPCLHSLPEYSLHIQNEKLQASIAADDDTYLDIARVALIQPPNGVFNPAIGATLQSYYENMLTVANDRLHCRKKFA